MKQIIELEEKLYKDLQSKLDLITVEEETNQSILEKKLMVEELALEDGLRSCFDSGELGLSLCFLVLEATTKQSFYLYRHGCLRKNVT